MLYRARHRGSFFYYHLEHAIAVVNSAPAIAISKGLEGEALLMTEAAAWFFHAGYTTGGYHETASESLAIFFERKNLKKTWLEKLCQ